MKRVEQGVPLEMLDLRTCSQDSPAAVPLLSEIVVDVLGPLESYKESAQIIDMWDHVARGLFEDYKSGAADEVGYEAATGGLFLGVERR